MATTALERCLQTARDAGVPRDQADTFLSLGYVPLPWQWEFHAAAREADNPGGPVEIGAGGARGPGKSHATFSQVGLDDMQRVTGLKCLFLRKTAVSAEESFQDLIDKTLVGKVKFIRTKNVLTINKGKIILGGFQNEDDIDKYIGIEYDIIVVEELNQLTKEKLIKLLGSLRTSKPNWRPRLYASFNPGGVGHTLVKERFVLPRRMHAETKTRFIPATYRDNLANLNREYIDYLEGLEGDLGRAWRDGDFDLFAGQYFKEWRYGLHVCQPFAIPDDWRRFKAGDAGYNQPSVGWYAVSPEGQLYRYRELYIGQMTASKLAAECVAVQNPNEKIDYEVWDPAFWAKKGENDNALSGAEIYEQKIKQLTGKAPRMVKGENSRLAGWTIVREYLQPYIGIDDETTAKLQVFSTCTEFIRTFPELQHDEHNPEDLDTDSEDHPADELRYAVMSRPRPAITNAQKEDALFRAKMKAKKQRLGSKLLFS